MTGKVTDLVEPIRKSVRLQGLREQGIHSRRDWDPEGGLQLRPTATTQTSRRPTI